MLIITTITYFVNFTKVLDTKTNYIMQQFFDLKIYYAEKVVF